MGIWNNGIYTTDSDMRGTYIRIQMRKKYPQIDDEFAVMMYGTEAEKAEHTAYRAEVKAKADLLYPKEGE